MKLVVTALVSALFQINASVGYAQKITLNKKNIALSSVLKSIGTQGGYDVVFNRDLLAGIKIANVDYKDVSVQQALDKSLANLPFVYLIEDGTIIIRRAPARAAVGGQQVSDILVSGIVIDSSNYQPLPSVSIRVRGKEAATKSASDGTYSIRASVGDVLTFSYVGFAAKDMTVRNGRVNVALVESSNTLNDVVVTGIVDRKEGNFTGASRTISGDDLKKVSSNNVFAGISAIDPSFRIVPNNIAGGNINQLPEVQMRGTNSFPNLNGELSTNPNLPLFILDGFEVDLQRIVDLDMNLINSITLLKDASATAIYGSRGANGVMVVKTVVPKVGSLQVTFNNDFRFTTPDLSAYHVLNAKDKLDFEKRTGVYGYEDGVAQYNMDVLYSERYKAALKGTDTDWLRLPVQNGYSNRSSLYLGGGDQVVRYALQFSADLQSGVMKGQNRNNYSGQFDLNYSHKKFQFRNSLRLFQNKSNESPYGDFSEYVSMNPYWSPYDENGVAKRYLENYTINGSPYRQTNPLYDATLHSVNSTEYFGFSNNFNLRYTPADFIYFESSLSLNKQKKQMDQFYSAQDSRFDDITDLSRKGTYKVQNENVFGYESLTTANFNKRFGKSQIFSNLALNFSSSSTNYYSILTEGFPYDQLDNLLFAAQYETNGKPTGDESTARRIGFVYSGSYSYDNRFIADVSLRRDGSSQYGEKKRFGTFWSTGIGWNIHNEKFFQKNEMVNRFKIRASYGSTGSLNIPAYASQFRYNFGVGTSYYGDLGATLIGLGNNLLSWQNVYKANVGMDLELFRSKLDLRLDLYRENTKNALTEVTLAPSTGFSSYSENLGEIQNTGFEFSARYKILEQKKKGLLWSVNVNGFTNKNVLKKLSNMLRASNDRLNQATDQTIPNVLFEEGQSINSIYVVRSLGVDPATGSEVYLTKDGRRTFEWNAADKVAYGVNRPKWNGNFGTNFMYKGFEVNLIFNYQFGGQLYNQTLIDRVESVDPRFNVDSRAYDLGWKEPGDLSQYTRIGVNTVKTKLTSRFVQDDNTLTLSSASLGYNFYRSQFIKRLGMRSFQITAITNDAFRISSINMERGTSNPFARTYSLSLRVGF